MNALRQLVTHLLIATLLLSGYGCALMQPIKPDTDPTRLPYGRIKSGAFVVLHLHDGRRVELVVDRVESDAILATDGQRYANREIKRAEVRRLTKGEVVVVGILVGAAVFVFLLVQAFGDAVDEIWR